MDERLKKYFELTKENSFIVKESKYVEIRIPDKMFDDKIAKLFGDKIEVFGFLDIYAWDEYKDDLEIKKAIKINFRLPNMIITKPNRIHHDSKNGEYVLEYKGGSEFITSTKLAQKDSIVVDFFKLILNGKMPDDIPYDQIPIYLEDCAKMNKFNMKVNSLFIDLIIAVVSRDPDNISRQFREAIKDNPRISMHSRKLINMDLIPSLISQFSAITSGNPKYGITSSIGAVKSGELIPEETDIEKAIE